MTVKVLYDDESRPYIFKDIKCIYLNGGLVSLVDINGVYRGSINLDKCTIFKVAEGENNG